jgi:spermidine synthase
VIPWEEIDRAKIPGHEGEVTLRKRGTEFSIRTEGTELMNSRLHGSEDALAELTCSRIKRESGLRILIGGLGMGYTLAAALKPSEPDTLIIVSELIPAVVRWNREHLGHLAGRPLDDPRVSVKEEDVMETIRKVKSAWNAILLDVDNGPGGLTRKANDRLYDRAGLRTSFAALRPGGILAIWSSGADEAFTRRLKQCGFQTETVPVGARKSGKGGRHTIWLAGKP